MPPGSAKSNYATVKFPAYYLGRHRDKGVISASYNDELASMFGRRVRNLVGSREYGRLFDLQLAPDQRAKGEWETSEGGFYFSCGVGGGVTGRRGDLLIADDLIRGRADADSDAVRKKTWEWWLSDFRTRGKPGYSLVLIMTRWHEDDPAGRILPDGWDGESGWVAGKDGESWYVICLPAQARGKDPLGRKEGEWLWPEWFTPDFWALTKAMQTPRNWNCLYEQRPTSEQGTYFKKEWWREYTGLPESLNVYMTIDAAITDEEDSTGDPDYTEIAVWGVDHLDRVYALDWYTARAEVDEWSDDLIRLIVHWKPQALIGGRANIEKTVVPFVKRELKRKRKYVTVEYTANVGDKPAKCRSFQALMSSGQVYWPKLQWAEDVKAQMMKFPGGRHDDKVDACGVLGMHLESVWEAAPPPKPPKTLAEVWNRPVSIQELIDG